VTKSDEVFRCAGPVLILAGPGTGKTYQLAKRIKYLVEEESTDPQAITVITFTAAAAANMRLRLSDPQRPELFLDPSNQPRSICTMHSLGYRIVRENAVLAGLQNIQTVVRSDHTKAILLEDSAQLCNHKREDASATEDCRQYGKCREDSSPKCLICHKYTEILRACSAVDYDDQILLACRVLRENPEIVGRYQAEAKHLLVDEYQDINWGQFELIRLLTKDQEEGLFVVGDDDQSIYSWRGGSPTFIRKFKRHFGVRAQVKPLLVSYRCQRSILEGAFSVVERFDKDRLAKGQFEYKVADGPLVQIHNVPSDKREAVIVKEIVQAAVSSSHDALILVPTRNHASLIAQALRKARLNFASPEPIPGRGLPLLNTLFMWLSEQTDSIALREFLESVLRGPKSPVPSLRAKKEEKKALRQAQMAKISGLWNNVLGDGVFLWNSLADAPQTEDVLKFLLETCERVNGLWCSNDTGDLLKEVSTLCAPWKSSESLMDEVSGWMSRLEEGSDAGGGSRIRVMTFQGAKGLEADVVCVIGLEDGSFPQAGLTEEELAEQSRLMFVSMTRAKRELHLFHARIRSGSVSFQQLHAKGRPDSLKASPFLAAIPKTYKEDRYHQSATR